MQVKSIAECSKTFIKLPFVFKIFVFSIFEWPLKAGFTVVILRKALAISADPDEIPQSVPFYLDLHYFPNLLILNLITGSTIYF